ncbi:hypothetical protein EDB19DRAFT_1580584, partial [Suillus lakei]
YTRQMDPFNAARVAVITHQITLRDDLTEDKREELEEFIANYMDMFTLMLKEVIPIPGSAINLNVPEEVVFNLRIHQRYL